MPTAAFVSSTSKRGNLSGAAAPTATTPPPPTTAGEPSQPKNRTGASSTDKKLPYRRSRSVSAYSRAIPDIDSQCPNLQDNPLFWATSSPPSDSERSGVRLLKLDDVSAKLSTADSRVWGVGGSGDGTGRGRSVSRTTSDGGTKSGGKNVSRSLSRVDAGRRRRSVSRGQYPNSESERELQCSLMSKHNLENKMNSEQSHANAVEKHKIAKTASDWPETLKGSHQSYSLQSKQYALETKDAAAISLMSSEIPCWEDGGSVSSMSEAEEKTIQPVTETKFIRSSSPAAENMLSDAIPHDLANQDAVGLVLDVRGEYARLLEESQDRARKLRAELAVEEHRGVELTKILKEITAELKTPSLQKPRAGRKASIERRKMSKRLEVEAMAYFDECVSISTFDGSDFSSFEDPPSEMVGTTDPSTERVNLQLQSSDTSSFYYSVLNQESASPSQFTGSNDGYALTSYSSIEDPSCRSRSRSTLNTLKTQSGLKPQFYFTQKPPDTSTFEQDIRNYAKLFPKENAKSSNSSRGGRSGHHDMNAYSLKVPAEQFLLDRMTFKNRIESGGLLLCGMGVGFPFSSFASGRW